MQNTITLLSCLLIIGLLNNCHSSTKPKISEEQFKQQATQMMGICRKVITERDPKRMYKGAWSIEKARVVSCRAIGEECLSYGQCLSKAIAFSKDHHISPEERAELFKIYKKLKEDIKDSLKVFSHEKNLSEPTK